MSRRQPALRACAFAALLVVACTPPPAPPRAPSTRPKPQPLGVQRTVFQNGRSVLRVNALSDELLHLELTGGRRVADASAEIPTTPMVVARAWSGPHVFEREAGGFTTAAIRAAVEPQTLCIALSARPAAVPLTRLCPIADGEGGLTLAPMGVTHVYGLGEQFLDPDVSDGEWVGRERTPGSEYGNRMVPFAGGSVGNLQIPTMMAFDDTGARYGLFVDHVYPLHWSFRGNPWRLATSENELRWFFFIGDSPLVLRRRYLEIVGRSPVPPRSAFGLWVSEYGFDDWGELEEKLRTLRQRRFPIDGFVLDLQWYGGIESGSDETRMGSLRWDEERFPDPAGRIATLRRDQGVGLMTIEQSYVGRALPEHAELARLGHLVRACAGCQPAYLVENPWWGKGGMIDWSNSAAARRWHDVKRRPLIAAGVAGHWTDLGEPELFDPGAWYQGVVPGRHAHRDVHNLYNLLWTASIAEGYARHGERRRPFVLSRSGTAGSWRYGAAIWSGDIGSNLESLATQLNVQMHMSMSGVDYFGSDVGGFHRRSVSGPEGEMYTRWLAASALLDVPLRPHTENLCNCRQTSPDRIGDLSANLRNVRLRYRLLPYLYSLAHRAHRLGEPLFPPLSFYFPDDPQARPIGDAKLIGPHLLVAITAWHGQRSRRVYLPAGRWYDWHDHSPIDSAGETLANVPLYRDGLYTLPLYARAGAIVPLMHVDEQTMNSSGRRLDGSRRDELILRVYPSASSSSFTLYEDDGLSTDYLAGAVRTTEVRQQRRGGRLEIEVGAAGGTYEGAVEAREQLFEIVVAGDSVRSVLADGKPLASLAPQSGREQTPGYSLDGGVLRVRLPRRPVDRPTRLVVLTQGSR